MTVRHAAGTRRWILVAALVCMVAATLPARAGDLADLDTSLKLVPKSAAFYSSSMRLGEQIEIAAGSRAWARLKAMPSVKEAFDLYEQQADDPDSPADPAASAAKVTQ